MTTSLPSTVVGVFKDRRQAERALEELRKAGFAPRQLGLIARHEPRSPLEANDAPDRDIGAGALTGSLVGSIAGLVVAVALFPVVGPVVLGGLFAAPVAGAATGAVLGGIVGTLVGLDVPEPHARYYEQEVNAGRTLVTVIPEGRYSEAVAILTDCGARDVERQRVVAAT